MLRSLTILALLLPTLLAPRPTLAARLEAREALGHDLAAFLVEDELRNRGEGERFSIAIESPPLPLANRATRPTEIAIATMRYDPAAGRFTGQLSARLDTGEASTIELRGSAKRLVEVAVPARRIGRGEALTEGDVEILWLPEAGLAADAIRHIEDLAGREARRSLPARRPARAADLVTPRLVVRGEPVTMMYESGGLTLSLVGEALDDGGAGETVRVANPGSRLVRQGLVVGARSVRVSLDPRSVR